MPRTLVSDFVLASGVVFGTGGAALTRSAARERSVLDLGENVLVPGV